MASNQATTDTKQIANKLVELCRNGEYSKAYDELFAKDAVAIEPENSQVPEKRTEGIEAFKQKDKQFMDMIKEIHASTVSEPLVTGNHIAVTYNMDVTMKDGNRMPMDEVAVYKVEDGKIVSQQFFY